MFFFPDIATKFPPMYLSYSQEGEDMILRRFFESLRIEKGFYVDVGAHHPTRFSNTFIFYLQGWRGINIDPTPGSKALFDEVRPEDLTLECAVGKHEELLFHIFNEGALNTFSASKAEAICNAGVGYQITEKIVMKKIPLAEILDAHISRAQKIEFLTIDAEGVDLEVAQSNDWRRYRPRLVLIENQERVEEGGRKPIRDFMADQDYRLAFRTVNTDIFMDYTQEKA